MKKVVSICIALLIFIGTCPAYAYELPSSFWPVNDQYAAALEAGDDWRIIDLASQSLAIIQNEPENEQTTSIRATRLEQMALAYARQQMYPEAADTFRTYIPYAEKMGWADAVKIAQAKVLQYTPEVSMYTPTQETVRDYNARLEPDKGVYYGVTSDSELRDSLPQASMVLLYLEFGDTYFDWIEHVLSTAQEEGRAVELAWNVPGQGSQIPDIVNQTAYIEQVLAMLNKYPDVPIFIRFGAEVDIWGDRADPTQFIEAFRHVANLVHEKTTNTAMVWSVNAVSTWDIHMEDYYPGDEYVDWVGVSLYLKKYFLGRNDWPEAEKFNEVVFLCGDNADPVKSLDEVIRKFGDRKPIMLAESGASHYSRSLGEDTSAFARSHLRELYYNVPMVYPQVKLIAYFDKVIESETEEYALSTSPLLAQEYKSLVQLPHFIQKDGGSPVAYKKLADGVSLDNSTMTVQSYVHLYRTDEVRVDYYIDGVWAGRSEQMPYTCTLDFSSFGPGTHEVTAVAEYNGGTKQAAGSGTVTVQPAITLYVNGQQQETDTAPMLVNERTFVPIRVVSEALGAQVGWDEATQTVTLTRSGDTISLQIGSNVLTKNGAETPLDATPFLEGDRTMVPVRAISEAFSAAVEWNAETRSVWIAL